MSKQPTTKTLSLRKSPLIGEIPKACASEAAAVEFLEQQRWEGKAVCPRCASDAVYQMKSANGQDRNARYLWMCRPCHKQFTVRVGTIFEDSKVDLHKWCLAFWLCAAAKNGLSALELSRNTQVSPKTALFILTRIRYAMAPDHATAPKLSGIVEADETYVGGKARHGIEKPKTPVFAVVQRDGEVRARVMPNITSANLKAALVECVEPSAELHTDELPAYQHPGKAFENHYAIKHSAGQYSKWGVTTNHIEGFFARLKRGIYGTFHSVSPEYLHRYVSEFEFRFNARQLNDGERVTNLIKRSEGKRITYRPLKVSVQVSKDQQEAVSKVAWGLTLDVNNLR